MYLNCDKNVFSWEDNHPILTHSNDCVVGCSTCANLCLGNAISFPQIEEVRNLYQENDIWVKVKNQLVNDNIIK